ncbi:hypothetical protein BMW23_0125 [Bodo saltans virus]|uniref:Uncharacterized protein n=1 Tax=Bodo saltans virus TaxID=2024608 RepID=A0A2H4UTN8_9VIRU|nr:hypothetical protein QJ851_gp0122 [Bodo saltans virus]ATZ80185.1 hypothetical protein BMW23_0125 [Bodo saltans virus]
MFAAKVLNEIAKSTFEHPYYRNMSGSLMCSILSDAFGKDLSIPSIYEQMNNTVGNMRRTRVIDRMYHEVIDDQKENLSDDTVDVLKKLSVFFEYCGSVTLAFLHNRECLKIAIILFAKNKKDDYFYTIETFESNALRLRDSFVTQYRENEMNQKLIQEQQQELRV